MEIDFMGLKSKQSPLADYDQTKQKNGMDLCTGDEISLSLSTTSVLDSHMGTIGFHENFRKLLNPVATTPVRACSSSYINTTKLRGLDSHNQDHAPINGYYFLVLSPTPTPSSTTYFPYDLNDKPTNSRKIFKLSTQFSSITGLHSSLPGKSENNFSYMEDRSSSTPISDAGKSLDNPPTVAMARRATLARFLKKRLHRMTQTRTLGLIRKSSTSPNFEACKNMNCTGLSKIRKKKETIS